MRIVPAIIATALLLPMTGPTSPAQESGMGSGMAVLVQAEDRARDAGACASDAEVMHVFQPEPGTSALMFPEDGCWAEWDVDLPGPAQVVVRWFNAGQATDCAVLEARSNGVLGGFTPEACGVSTFIESRVEGVVPGGARTLRLTFQVTGGPSWDNLFMDWVRFEVGGGCPGNAAPTPPGPVASDGMDAGGAGWSRFGYDFQLLAEATDPDGDPLRYRWSWGDGAAAWGGPAASHAYAAPGRFDLRVEAIDDPSARDVPGCPPLAPASAASGRTFHVIRDFRTTWTSPPEGFACLDGMLVRAGDALGNAILLNCRVTAAVDAERTALVARVEFRLDGAAFDHDSAQPYEAMYHSLMASLTYHRLEACASAHHDKHEREFCSDPYVFLNLGGSF